MTDKEKIKAEIESQLKIKDRGYSTGDAEYGYRDALEDILRFIDSLPEEPMSKYLEEASDEYYYETWDEHGGKAMVVDGSHDIWFPSQATGDFFKAGAQWKKEQMIDKACKWLNANIEDHTRSYEDYDVHDAVASDYSFKKEFIEAFKKELEGEK